MNLSYTDDDLLMILDDHQVQDSLASHMRIKPRKLIANVKMMLKSAFTTPQKSKSIDGHLILLEDHRLYMINSLENMGQSKFHE